MEKNFSVLHLPGLKFQALGLGGVVQPVGGQVPQADELAVVGDHAAIQPHHQEAVGSSFQGCRLQRIQALVLGGILLCAMIQIAVLLTAFLEQPGGFDLLGYVAGEEQDSRLTLDVQHSCAEIQGEMLAGFVDRL